MRLLVLNHEYPPIGGGGGQACQNLVDALAERGYEITVITSLYKGLLKEEVSQNVRILRVPSLRRQPFRIGFLRMAVYMVSSIIVGWKTIKKWKPDLIHVHFAVPAGVSALVLHLFFHIPYILTTHLGDVPGGVPDKTDRWFRFVFPFTKPVWKNAASIVAVSKFTASLALQQYHVNPHVIPNGMAVDAENDDLVVNDPPVIAFAGRFVQQKNLFVIIDILDSIRDLNWVCTLIGDGPLYGAVADKIESLGLSGRVSLPGWVTPNEVISQFNKSDILLMPSLSEGLSVVGVQALSAGLAIVANEVGGFSDLVEKDQNGVLAEVGDTQTLKAGIRKFLFSKELLSEARLASLRVARKFDINHVADQYEAIFLSICKE